MFVFKTILEGERAAVWDRQGRVEFVSGPRRLLLRGKSVQPLQRHAAGAGQYLVVTFKDGRSQHLHGPAAVWFHPVEHESITVEPAVALDANEAVVVYAQQQDRTPAAEGEAGPDRVSRRVVRGPALFMPAANEWLHEFSWHGADPDNPRRKVPRAVRFNKLRVIPDQTYFDVEAVRTADDALLVVKLMIFFELVDVETMLDRTHDPVADFINAVTADVMDFAAGLTFEQFKQRTEALNDLATYKQLVQRAERIGYRVGKVVHRGYEASGKLQSMHDNAIEARTKLRLEADTETQAQELADLKLQREMDRADKRRQMEEEDLAHANRLKRLTHDEELRRQQVAHDAALEAKRRAGDADLEARQKAGDVELEVRRKTGAAELENRRRAAEFDLDNRRRANEVEAEHLKEKNRERLALLQAMQGMRVDLTRYLIAQYQHPDRHIRIDGGGLAKGNSRLHLHDGPDRAEGPAFSVTEANGHDD